MNLSEVGTYVVVYLGGAAGAAKDFLRAGLGGAALLLVLPL
jgi:hypothetical protein